MKENRTAAHPEQEGEFGGNIAEREQRVAEARKFNLLSNVFMSVALNDAEACQYVLRILTGLEDLVVKEVRTQYRVAKIQSHDAVLDVLAEDKAGRLYNLEIQRSDTVDHARRTRFYGSMIDSEYLKKGSTYAQMPEVYIIYISETDLWKDGFTIYLVKKYFGDTGIPYDDGLHILYVNAQVDDGSETAKLMEYFRATDPNDMGHGALSERVHYLKCEEGGYKEMCEISEKIYRDGMAKGMAKGIAKGMAEGITKGITEGITKGRREEKKETAINLSRMGMSEELIACAVNASEDQVRDWLSEMCNAVR